MEGTEAVNRVPEQTSLREKDPSAKQDENGSERLSVSAGTGEGDYPTGLGLVFVVAALILAIFLTSLDTVSNPSSRQKLLEIERFILTYAFDFIRQSLQRLSHELPTSSTV